MKLIFFLVAFCLVGIRVYFSWLGKDKQRRGETEYNMNIVSDNIHEEINYSGKFGLTDDETGFKTISPGGYMKFRMNDVKVKAESSLQGKIEYRIYDGKDQLSAEDESGKKLIAKAIREMIGWGFDANARMERVYRKGGIPALLSEADSMRSDDVKAMYLDRLISIDSLSSGDLLEVAKKIGSLGSDMGKASLLNKFSAARLKDPQIDSVYFKVVSGMGSDMDKVNTLRHMMDQDSLEEGNVYQILALAGHMGSDMDKSNLFGQLMDKGLIQGARFDSLLNLISDMGSDMDKVNLYSRLIEHQNITEPQWTALLNEASRLGSDMDKINMYKKLMEEKAITESQWEGLLDKTAQLGSDMDKANLLTEIARKMPKDENLKIAYMKSAKSIGNDSDYGRVIRAME
ncbi:MAG TPA: hypothetical protein VGM24_05640 [Puia sp.]|jgi:hypothetical protein